MRSFRDYWIETAVVVGALVSVQAMSACGASSEGCPKPLGEYRGTYGLLGGGTCTRVPPGRSISFAPDDEINTTKTMNSTGGFTSTEVDRLGCTLAVKQDVLEAGVNSTLMGELSVEGDALLSGQLMYLELMPDGITERCRSQVTATFAREDGVSIGAAAQHATAAP
ncbi:MAG: hypothetical protein RL701_1518 [Pseudomonadota bacterium]|jgi:hypothetical protein